MHIAEQPEQPAPAHCGCLLCQLGHDGEPVVAQLTARLEALERLLQGLQRAVVAVVGLATAVAGLIALI